MSVRNTIFQAYKSSVETVLPVRTRSEFKELRVLTPEEFVETGDYLVRACPTWSWDGGDPSKSVPYLPKDKQFLVTKNVPSYKRAVALEGEAGFDVDVVEDDNMGDDGWVEAGKTSEAPVEDIPSIADDRQDGAGPSEAAGETDDEDIPNIDDLELEDDDVAAIGGPGTEDSGILRTRTYDLMISYDKYYSTPRLWLVGYDEGRTPLARDQILEDVSAEHAKKTATVESFPHQGTMAVAIHPCKHALVMKKLGDMMEANGEEFHLHMYMVLFLKFIQSVVPTIEYDFTMSAKGK